MARSVAILGHLVEMMVLLGNVLAVLGILVLELGFSSRSADLRFRLGFCSFGRRRLGLESRLY